MTQHTETSLSPTSAAQRQGRRTLCAVLILALAGLSLLLYPLGVTLLHNSQQVAQVDQYRRAHAQVDDHDRNFWLQRAREYNAQFSGAPILDPWLRRVARDNDPYQNYVRELNPSGTPDAVMAVIAVPSIGVKLPVLHGSSPHTLEQGVGHLYGSALPVGGVGTHSIVTGHTGLVGATMFDKLIDVAIGDAIYIDVLGETLKYEVGAITTVLPDEISQLQPVADQDLLTLITCTPYGINTHRLLVQAHRVDVDTHEAAEVFDHASIWQPWMIVVLGIIVLFVLILAYYLLRTRHRTHTTELGRHRITEESAS
ncbi:MAG: class C sortase [Corynebacterium sp.]|uniref:class C sortase n=1 Tax=Corynebacterium sp. TaxID=1720 RepID=UPI0026DD80D5|nr:class C sortase [Corynebacterium sp.]MDO4760774.1 class C sortase [Corynebacterium sp.]